MSPKYVARIRFPDGTYGLTKSCEIDELIQGIRELIPVDLVYQLKSTDGKIELTEIGHLGLQFKARDYGKESNGVGASSIQRSEHLGVDKEEPGGRDEGGVSSEGEAVEVGSDSKLGT
jgi:hypothetical protein